MAGFAGPSLVENMPAMLNKRPLYDDYWASKYIHTENINNVPLYITGSYSSQLHSRSSFHTFRTAKSTQKWFRVHPYYEWYDLYRPESVNDLQRYFDYFLKGIDNGWERDTPKVRMSLLGFESGGSVAKTVSERPEGEFPLARQELRTFHLNSTTKKLEAQAVPKEAITSHVSNDNNPARYVSALTATIALPDTHLNRTLHSISTSIPRLPDMQSPSLGVLQRPRRP